MKLKTTLTTLLAAGLMLVAFAAPAQAVGNEKVKSSDMAKKISAQLSLPASMIKPNMEMEVKVDFRVNAAGEVEVIRVYTDNSLLKEHVKKQFQSLQFSDAQMDTGKVYRIPVKYRVV